MSDPKPDQPPGDARGSQSRELPRSGGRPREPAAPKPPSSPWNAGDPDATMVSLDDDLERDPMLSSLVAAVAEPVDPPPEVRTRLLSEFRTSMITQGVQRPGPSRSVWTLVPWSLAAMFAAVAFIGWNALYASHDSVTEMQSAIAQLQSQRLSDMQMLARSRFAELGPAGATANEQRSGVLAWSPDGTWHLWVMLPPPDSDKVYQAWFITKDGQAISAGLLRKQGEVYGLEITVPDELKDKINATGITQEPPGGSTSPTPPILLQGSI